MNKLQEAKKGYYDGDIQKEIIIMDDYIKQLEKVNQEMLGVIIKINDEICQPGFCDCSIETSDIIEKAEGKPIDEGAK